MSLAHAFRVLFAVALLVLPACGACVDSGPLFSAAAYLGDCAAPAEWLVQGTGRDGVNNPDVLPDGTHYVIGFYGNTSSVFGPDNAADASEGGDEGWAPFVTRYAPDRSLDWAIYGAGATASSRWNTGGMAACLDGGCVFAVAHAGAVRFRDALGGWHDVPAGTGYSLVVVRANAEGEILWIQRANSTGGNIFGFGCRCLSDGSIVLCGGALRGGVFGDTWDANAQTVDSAGSACYVWKLDESGHTTWLTVAETENGTLHPYYNGFLQLREDARGDLLVTGMVPPSDVRFSDGSTLGGAGSGAGDVVVAHIRTLDGAKTWAQRVAMETASRRAVVSMVMPAPSDDIYLALSHAGDLRFPDGSTVVREAGYDAGQSATLLRMEGSTGALRWKRVFRTASTSNELVVSDIDTTEDGRLLVAGKFPPQSEVMHLNGVGAEHVLETFEGVDAMAARFDADGRIEWIHTDGGPGYDHACNVLILPNGCHMITGFSSGSVTFARGTVLERTLVSQGDWDGWRYFINADGTFDAQ